MSQKSSSGGKRNRRQFTQDVKDEAVGMLRCAAQFRVNRAQSDIRIRRSDR